MNQVLTKPDSKSRQEHEDETGRHEPDITAVFDNCNNIAFVRVWD